MDLVFNPADRTYRFGGRVITEQALGDLMADRPYQTKTGSELSRILANQLTQSRAKNPSYDPIEVTAFGDAGRSWLVDGAVTSTANVETTFRVGADGRPEAVTRLVDKPSVGAARNGGESELAWLKRRVDEICWRPT
jgi:hypothetical protein